MKKTSMITAVLLVLSLILGGIYFYKAEERIKYIRFNNLNLEENYETIHHIKEAHKLSTGKGVKVGILGKYFGYDKHPNIYTFGKDFVNDNKSLKIIDEHGFWMATTLKEIAPDVEIYALNVRSNNREKEAKAIVKAIDWAIENEIDVLTYSSAPFQENSRDMIDNAVNKAVKNNIVTTFIHYSNKNNILPYGLLEYKGSYERSPDLRIFHYDFNILIIKMYKKYIETENNNLPYLSMSSLSPVLGGFIALLKEINNNLEPDEYRRILLESSYNCSYDGKEFSNIVNIEEAINYLSINY